MQNEQKKKYDPKEYQRNKDKYLESQRKCRNNPKNRERYLEDARKRSKEWYQRPGNKERRYVYNRASWKKHIKKLEEIAGRKRSKICEICYEDGIIVFDHNHKTGLFRGWICVRCNTVLGKIKDNKNLLKKLISYLN